jgi:cardiolipin synthase
LSAHMRQRQESYIERSRQITVDMVAQWTWRRELWNNAIAMLGPVL